MTPRQELEAAAIVSEFAHKEMEDGLAAIVPTDLAHDFRAYLMDEGFSCEVFDNFMATDILKFSQVVLRYPLSQSKDLVRAFAEHQATQLEADIPSYWDGTIPPL